ncbi:hypothetical protein BB560_005819, partial [Smittium megazygosporum]
IVNNATKFQNLASVVNIPSSLRSTETHRTLIFSLQDPDSVAESFLHQIYSLPESLVDLTQIKYFSDLSHINSLLSLWHVVAPSSVASTDPCFYINKKSGPPYNTNPSLMWFFPALIILILEEQNVDKEDSIFTGYRLKGICEKLFLSKISVWPYSIVSGVFLLQNGHR